MDRREGLGLRGDGDLFLIAFSQEIDVGLKHPDSQDDSTKALLPDFDRDWPQFSRTYDRPRRSCEGQRGETFVPSGIVYFRAAYSARTNLTLLPFNVFLPPPDLCRRSFNQNQDEGIVHPRSDRTFSTDERQRRFYFASTSPVSSFARV